MMRDGLFRISKTWGAVATLVGSTVGIGFLGIPYTFEKAGFGIGVILLVLVSGLFLINNLLYGEIILRTHYRHQFLGFVRTYLGPRVQKINLFTFWTGVYGSTIGTLIISGYFLSSLLAHFGKIVSPFILSSLFFILAVGFVYRGLRAISLIDFVVLFIIFLIVVVIAIVGFPQINFSNFDFSSGTSWFLPFGVIMFALNGISGIPLAREVLIGQERKLKQVIIIGTLIPAAFYLLFSLLIVGVAGPSTTEASILGLEQFLGRDVTIFGLILGLFTSTTIFISMITAFRESLAQDFHYQRKQNFVLFILPAYLLFLAGVTNFINILGLVGGLAVGIDMITLLFVYSHVKRDGDRIPEFAMHLPKIIMYCMMIIFAAAAVYTLIF